MSCILNSCTFVFKLDRGYQVPDAPLIDIVSLFETKTLRMMKLTIPVWKKERFHFVYQEMLRLVNDNYYILIMIK